MTYNPPIIVTWNCGNCDTIHEQGFEDHDAAKSDAMGLCASIVMNETVPDFSVRVRREGVYMDDTQAVLVALAVHALMDLVNPDEGE